MVCHYKKLKCWFVFRLVSLKLGVTIDTFKLYILISVWITLAFIQGHSCMRNLKILCPVSGKFLNGFGENSVCCHNLLVC